MTTTEKKLRDALEKCVGASELDELKAMVAVLQQAKAGHADLSGAVVGAEVIGAVQVLIDTHPSVAGATDLANAMSNLQPRAAAWANHHYPADVGKLIAALNETASSLVFDALRQDYARDALPDDLAAMLVTLLAIADMIEIDLIALVERKIQ